MSSVGTVNNVSAYVGLFTKGSGVIHNLDIVEATLIVELTSDDENNYDGYVGAFLGYANINGTVKHGKY